MHINMIRNPLFLVSFKYTMFAQGKKQRNDINTNNPQVKLYTALIPFQFKLFYGHAINLFKRSGQMTAIRKIQLPCNFFQA